MRSVRSSSLASTGSSSSVRKITSPWSRAFHSFSFIVPSLCPVFCFSFVVQKRACHGDTQAIKVYSGLGRVARVHADVFNFLHFLCDSSYKLSIDISPVYSIIYIIKCVDGKKYHTIPPVQRAAVWCKAVSVSWEKSSRSSLLNGCTKSVPVSSAGCSRYSAGLCWKSVRGRAQHANESGTAESLMITRSLSLGMNRGQGPFLLPPPPAERK